MCAPARFTYSESGKRVRDGALIALDPMELAARARLWQGRLQSQP